MILISNIQKCFIKKDSPAAYGKIQKYSWHGKLLITFISHNESAENFSDLPRMCTTTSNHHKTTTKLPAQLCTDCVRITNLSRVISLELSSWTIFKACWYYSSSKCDSICDTFMRSFLCCYAIIGNSFLIQAFTTFFITFIHTYSYNLLYILSHLQVLNTYIRYIHMYVYKNSYSGSIASYLNVLR